MTEAAILPRLRVLIVCDQVIASDVEVGVFTLEGVRQHLEAASFPHTRELNLFLVLSSPRRGTWEGKILLINAAAETRIRYSRFRATFTTENELLPLWVEIGACEFPEPGLYTIEVHFSVKAGRDVLKGELPLFVQSIER